jgi:cytochrome c oxidase assembly protein subunit 15
MSKGTIVRTTVNLLTFFVVFEAAIGAVIVLYEWVGLNSSLPRIIAVPIHLVNTFGLLACYAALYKVLLNNFKNIKQLWDRRFVFVAFLFLLSGATGSITALADVLFPSASFYEGLMEDFDRTSELLTRLRILHPLVATGLSVALIIESRKIQKDYKIDVKFLQLLVIVAVTLGVLNVLSNIVLLLSILHLAIADLLWISYIYVSMDKIKINHQ